MLTMSNELIFLKEVNINLPTPFIIINTLTPRLTESKNITYKSTT